MTNEAKAEAIREMFGAGDGLRDRALEILNESEGTAPQTIAERIRTEFGGGESLTPKILEIVVGGVAVTSESTTGIEPSEPTAAAGGDAE